MQSTSSLAFSIRFARFSPILVGMARLPVGIGTASPASPGGATLLYFPYAKPIPRAAFRHGRAALRRGRHLHAPADRARPEETRHRARRRAVGRSEERRVGKECR